MRRLVTTISCETTFPFCAMASHVTICWGRKTPMKFRCDVASSGRLGLEMQPKKMTADELALVKNALAEYRRQDIQSSLASENPLVRMFAILDRRAGRRTLAAQKALLDAQPEWLQAIYRLRTKLGRDGACIESVYRAGYRYVPPK